MNFRQFCTEMWYVHKEEFAMWNNRLPEYESSDYFRRYKWMLKSLYKQSGGDLSFIESLK